jgi:hypothetical protein
VTTLPDDPSLAAIGLIRATLEHDEEAASILWPDDLGPYAAHLIASLAGMATAAIRSDAGHQGLTPGEYLDVLVRAHVRSLT